MNLPPLFKHQQSVSDLMQTTDILMNASDAGTGKSRMTADGIVRRTPNGRTLILAPLSILDVAWVADLKRFFPDKRVGIAHGKNRWNVVNDQTLDFVVTNHDAVKWLVENLGAIRKFDELVVDESPIYKTKSSQRTKAAMKIAELIPKKTLLTGTPTPNSVMDAFCQYKLLDGGERLGQNYYRFLNRMTITDMNGPFAKHIDRPDAPEILASLTDDITVRYGLRDCIDMPDNTVTDMQLDMPPWLEKQYKAFVRDKVLTVDQSTIAPLHAGSLVQKLLQMLSGALYDENGEVTRIHEDRYNLVMDLIDARQQCICAYNYKHELSSLKRWAEKPAYNFPYGVISGGISPKERKRVVEQFQAGKLRVIFLQPASGAHGLTLTAGTTTIWVSPNYRSDLYAQTNARIDRAGQKQKTETIRIAYRDSQEMAVYRRMDDKTASMNELLSMFAALTEAA